MFQGKLTQVSGLTHLGKIWNKGVRENFRHPRKIPNLLQGQNVIQASHFVPPPTFKITRQ